MARFGSKIANRLAENVTKQVSSQGNAIRDKVKDSKQEITNTVSDASNEIKHEANRLDNKIEDSGREIANAVSGVSTEIKHEAGRLEDKIEDSGRKMTNTVSEVSNEINATCLDDKVQAVGQTITELPAAAREVGQDAVARVQEKIENTSLDGLGGNFGDLVCPENAESREKAMQLERHCRFLEVRCRRAFTKTKILEAQVPYSALMCLEHHDLGSVELAAEVDEIMESKAFKDWTDIRKKIARDLGIEKVVEGVGVATTAGTLVGMGLASGPVGWAALGAVGTAATVTAGGMMVASVIKAKEQGELLDSAIKKLSQVREQLASCYFRIMVANEWLVSFRVATSMSVTNPANATRQKHATLAETLRKRDSNRCTTTWAASILKDGDEMKD